MMVKKYIGILIFLAFVASANAQTTNNSNERHQFDFWIGEWDVSDSGQVIATSKEEMVEDSSILIENYFEKDGYTGKSINFYDGYLKRWRQVWVDQIGNVSEFYGTYTDGAMRFEGESHRNNGKRILRKLTFFNLGNKVRQFSEASIDSGKTWRVTYDYLYLRKNKRP